MACCFIDTTFEHSQAPGAYVQSMNVGFLILAPNYFLKRDTGLYGSQTELVAQKFLTHWFLLGAPTIAGLMSNCDVYHRHQPSPPISLLPPPHIPEPPPSSSPNGYFPMCYFLSRPHDLFTAAVTTCDSVWVYLCAKEGGTFVSMHVHV